MVGLVPGDPAAPGDILTAHASELGLHTDFITEGDLMYIDGMSDAYLIWHADADGVVMERMGSTGAVYLLTRHPDQLEDDERLALVRMPGGDLVHFVTHVAVLGN